QHDGGDLGVQQGVLKPPQPLLERGEGPLVLGSGQRAAQVQRLQHPASPWRRGEGWYHPRLRRPPMPYFDLDPLLETMLDAAPNISDLNLSVGRPPQVEVDGQLRTVPYGGIERLLPYQTELIAMRLMAGKRDATERLVRTGSTDLSYSLARRTRFRVNIFAQRGSYSVVLRVIPSKVPT